MIGLVFCGDLKYCPYLKRYTDLLDEHKIDYNVMFWNRSSLENDIAKNYIYYDSHSDLKNNKIKKLFDFLGFRRWLKKQFKSKKFDKIILLSTLSGIFIYDILKKYKGKYIFDIRDYSYEHIPLFFKIEKSIIHNSSFTAISSAAFKRFLPKYDNYIIAHNFNPNEAQQEFTFNKISNKPVNLVWNGTIRYFEHQKFILDALKNDERFIITYHGAGIDLDKYKEYCLKNNINNVVFTGMYDNSSKAHLLLDADILNNSYGIEQHYNEVKYAVSNRYYDGIIYHIPQLAEFGTYKAEMVENQGIGIALEFNEEFADNLYRYYNNIASDEFDNACNGVLEQVIADDITYINKIKSFITSI